MKKNNTKKRGGFTLVELLVVTVMLSVICLALYSTFASGARIWQRINRMSLNEDVNILFDRFSWDIRNSIVFTGLKFTGTQGRFELPTLVMSQALGIQAPGMVIYACNGGTLTRSQKDYSQIYQDTSAPARKVMSGLGRCNFTYYQYDNKLKQFGWVDEWEGQGLPFAIRMELKMGLDENATNFTKTVTLPLGGNGINVTKVKDE